MRPDGGLDWSLIRAGTYIDDTLFYAKNDSMLYRRTFNGTTYGTEQAIDPYNDPAWSNVNTGSGQTFRGVRPTFYNELELAHWADVQDRQALLHPRRL